MNNYKRYEKELKKIFDYIETIYDYYSILKIEFKNNLIYIELEYYDEIVYEDFEYDEENNLVNKYGEII